MSEIPGTPKPLAALSSAVADSPNGHAGARANVPAQTAGLTTRPWSLAVETFLAALGFFVFTVAAMWPVLTHSSYTVLGSIQPNDDTAGGIWLAWQLQSLTPFSPHTMALNAPHGVDLWQPSYITAMAWLLPLWLFAHLTDRVTAYDWLILLGFVSDCLAMYGLVRWLVGKSWIAFVAGLLYAFSPFHIEESWAHVGYLDSWIFPLILWAGLAFMRKPTVFAAILFGASTALGAYADGYYIVFSPVMAGSLALAGVVAAGAVGVDRRRLLAMFVPAFLSYCVVSVPVALVYLTAPATVGALLARAESTVYFYSARVWEYFVPWSQSVIWGRWDASYVNSLLGTGRGSGELERSLYLGAGVIILAGGFWLLSLFKAKGWSIREVRIPLPALSLILFGTAFLTWLCSFATIGPFPGFPILVWHVEPIWRVYTRLFVAVDCAVLVAAAVMLAYLWSTHLRWLAVAGAVLALVDGTGAFPTSTWSYAAHMPPAYQWLADHQDGGVVAVYPMLRPPEWAFEVYQSYQPYYRHDLYNGAPNGTADLAVQRGLNDLSDPQTVPGLKRLGVKYVVVDNYHYRAYPPYTTHLILHGLKYITSGDRVTLYRIANPEPSIGMITVNSGFYPEAAAIPHVHRWMFKGTATLGLFPFKPWKFALFHAYIRSAEVGRHVTISQNGHVLWRHWVPTHPVTVVASFPVARHGKLVIHTTPGAIFAPGYQIKHYFALNVYDLSLSHINSRRR